MKNEINQIKIYDFSVLISPWSSSFKRTYKFKIVRFIYLKNLDDNLWL